MNRFASLVLSSLAAFGCGGAPAPMPYQPPVTPPTQPSNIPTNTASGTVLGACTGEDGSTCGNGRGVCVPGLNTTSKQCLALAASGSCPRGSFGAQYQPGKTVCLDLCTSVRDCATGFFCNPTVVSDSSGASRSVSVCMPGVINSAGMACERQSDCERGDTDLQCVGATSTSNGICTKSCNTSTDCQGRGNTTAVCGKDSTGKGLCFQACTSFCGGDNVCQSNICLPKPAASSTGTYGTPSFGQLGGACATSNDCEGRYLCLTSRPGGLCTATCQSNAECGNGVCVNQPDGTGVCFARCQTPGAQSTCRSGYQCRGLQGLSYGYCL